MPPVQVRRPAADMDAMKRTPAAVVALLIIPTLAACGGAGSDAARACDGYDAQQDAWAAGDVETAVEDMDSMLESAEAAATLDSEYRPMPTSQRSTGS